MAEPAPAVDLAKFKSGLGASVRGGAPLGLAPRYTGAQQLFAMAQLGHGMDPNGIPVSVLQLMAAHPAVYLAERTVSGIIRRPDLYSVRHSKPAIAAEAEAWLWPILEETLSGAARGFAYGSVGMVFDWEREPLYYEVAKPGKKARRKTSPAHTHYVRAVELHPDTTQALRDEFGRFNGLNATGGTFNRNRSILWAWDPEFGEVLGQGARRRAWQPYCEYLILSLLRNKYLERSVDAPRIAFTPEGQVVIDDVTYQIPDHVTKLLLELQGSGACALPGKRDENGNRLYEVDSLEVNEAAAAIFEDALNRCDAQIMLAYLLAPPMGGVDDAGGSAAGRALDGMLREQIEDIATFAARGLTKMLATVHRVNYELAETSAPEAIATDVGKAAARRVFQAVLQLVNAAADGEIALRTDVPALLDKLGIPLRDEPPPGVGGEVDGQGPGRPLDTGSDRENRREDATTDEGGQDTGGDNVERDHQGD